MSPRERAKKPNEINVSPVSPRVPSFLKQDAADDDFEREALKKRAAIMEFDGGMTRADAEAAARALLGLAAKKVAVESFPDPPNKDAADAQQIGDRKRLSTAARSAPLTQDSRGGG